MAQLRVLIAGGGTGGHIIPALAVARALQSHYNAEILFVGTARGLESRLVPDAGFNLQLIHVGQFNNVSLFTRLRTLFSLPLSVLSCSRLISRFKPQVVFGVGGYASWPTMAAAILRGIPTIAFEPNAVPGLANRLIGKYVRRGVVNFQQAARWFRNAEVTGIPVRTEFFSLPAPPATPPHLLVFGGSQGARILNNALPQIAGKLLAAIPGLTILHQAGAHHAASTEAAYKASGADLTRITVAPFLDDMPARFARANLILARGGASTVAELAAAAKPALLVPFAAAADAHQLRNTQAMQQAGAAELIEESELTTPAPLEEKLIALLRDPARLTQMSAAARTLAHPNADQRIADIIASLHTSTSTHHTVSS